MKEGEREGSSSLRWPFRAFQRVLATTPSRPMSLYTCFKQTADSCSSKDPFGPLVEDGASAAAYAAASSESLGIKAEPNENPAVGKQPTSIKTKRARAPSDKNKPKKRAKKTTAEPEQLEPSDDETDEEEEATGENHISLQAVVQKLGWKNRKKTTGCWRFDHEARTSPRPSIGTENQG